MRLANSSEIGNNLPIKLLIHIWKGFRKLFKNNTVVTNYW